VNAAAAAVSSRAGEGDLDRVARLAGLGKLLAADVVVEVEPGGAAIRGRDAVVGLASQLAAAGLPARLRRLPPGILTDSVPFARRGVAAVTIGRLTWRTLRTIHTPRDTAEGLSLETAERIGRALAAN
jgi:hypothetical protein